MRFVVWIMLLSVVIYSPATKRVHKLRVQVKSLAHWALQNLIWGRYFHSASFCLWLTLLFQGRALNYFPYDAAKYIDCWRKQLRSHYTARTIKLVFSRFRPLPPPGSQNTSLEVRQAFSQELPFENQREFHFGYMIPFWVKLVDPIIAMWVSVVQANSAPTRFC